MVILDSEKPFLASLEERLRHSNAFLKNLILSSVDGVMAADLKGKILIFNDAASEITGYSSEEALNQLNIRDIYPPKVAYAVMQKLRGDNCGGRGKLQSYQVDVRGKDGQII
ncbi:MAG: PAS domain S-box protein, partial [Desulfobacterales bacterium]